MFQGGSGAEATRTQSPSRSSDRQAGQYDQKDHGGDWNAHIRLEVSNFCSCCVQYPWGMKRKEFSVTPLPLIS